MEEETLKKQHTLHIEDRSRLNVTGVTDVSGFDDDALYIKTDQGDVTVRGSDLQVTKLDLDAGILRAEGVIDGIGYSAAPKKNKKSFFKGS